MQQTSLQHSHEDNIADAPRARLSCQHSIGDNHLQRIRRRHASSGMHAWKYVSVHASKNQFGAATHEVLQRHNARPLKIHRVAAVTRLNLKHETPAYTVLPPKPQSSNAHSHSVVTEGDMLHRGLRAAHHTCSTICAVVRLPDRP